MVHRVQFIIVIQSWMYRCRETYQRRKYEPYAGMYFPSGYIEYNDRPKRQLFGRFEKNQGSLSS